LPSFNVDDPGARAYLIDSAVYWLREFAVDGYRLDHAIAPSMDFWVAFKRATEAAKPGVVNVGEATDTPDSLLRYRGKLHGVLDFELARALRVAFGKGTWSVAKLDAWLESYERYMEAGPGRVSFLDNHDMDRFLWVAENDVNRLKLAALCQFTLSATPVVYYGTEIGMTQTQGSDAFFGADENARGDMPWDESLWDRDLLSFYQTVIRMRTQEPVLGSGGRRTVHIDDTAGTYGYVRAQSDHRFSSGDVLTLFNLGDAKSTIRLPDELEAARLETLAATGDRVQLRGNEIALGPRTGAAFRISRRSDSEAGS
jgi:glycosidase